MVSPMLEGVVTFPRKRLVCALSAVVVVAACGGGGETTAPPDPPPPPPPPPPPTLVVTTVSVSPAAAALVAGDTVRLRATVRDQNGNEMTGRTIGWSSSSSTIATVTTDGLVTAVAGGSATITATVETRSGTATLSVTARAPLPSPSCEDCLEVLPGSLLLGAVGAQQQLSAFVVDAAGNRTPVAATFTSSRSGIVSVTPAGVATAVSLGSAQITAQAAGRTSEPVLAIVASPAAGSMLVPDDRVHRAPQAVTPGAPFRVGYRYTVQTSGPPPTVGQAMLGTGTHAILGRVERVAAAGPGITEVELEVRPVAEILPNLTFNETWTLPAPTQPTMLGQRRGTSGRVAPLVQRPLKEGEYRVGPFTCKPESEITATIPLNAIVETLELSPSLGASLAFNNGELVGFGVSGELRPRMTLTPRVQAAVTASVTCKVILYELPIPVRGALALIINPDVPVGLGFKIGGTLPAQAGARIGFQGLLRLSAGLACVSGVCAYVGNPEGTFDGIFEPLVGGPATGQVDLDARVFAFATVEVTNPVTDALGENVKLELLDLTGGLRQSITVASPATQATSATYASGAALDLFYEAKREIKVELGSLWRVQAFEATNTDSVTLAQTPKGFLQVNPSSAAAGTQAAPGDTVLLRVALNSTTWLTLNAVEGVEIFWQTPSGLVSVCGFMTPERPMQSEYECALTFQEQHVGNQSFYAFVTARIYGAPFATPFEVAAQSRVVVQVTPPRPPPAQPIVYFGAGVSLPESGCSDLSSQNTGTSANLLVEKQCAAIGTTFSAQARNTSSLNKGTVLSEVKRLAPRPPLAESHQTDVGAETTVEDQVTIDAPGLTGTTGTFRISIDFTGEVVATSGHCATGEVTMANWSTHVSIAPDRTGNTVTELASIGMNRSACATPPPWARPLPTVVQSAEATFIYGTPFWLNFSVNSGANQTYQGTFPANGTSTARSAVTFRWLGMTGLPPGATLQSASGIDWSKSVPP